MKIFRKIKRWYYGRKVIIDLSDVTKECICVSYLDGDPDCPIHGWELS